MHDIRCMLRHLGDADDNNAGDSRGAAARYHGPNLDFTWCPELIRAPNQKLTANV